jgi:hypothetical protein
MLLTVVMTGKTFQEKICFSCTGGVFALDRYLLMGDPSLLSLSKNKPWKGSFYRLPCSKYDLHLRRGAQDTIESRYRRYGKILNSPKLGLLGLLVH